MTKHISARLAWHNDGWNGHICKKPKENTYCVGQYSFPGDMIAERRELDIEVKHAGVPISKIENYIPPCIWSCNAFGDKSLLAYNPPPSWFNDGTNIKKWDLPPYTICVWPYEEMYLDEVLTHPKQKGMPKYDPVARRDRANEYFKEISPSKSLIFYYANYSNPFSENDEHQYVIVGVSRIKHVGGEITWDNQSSEMEDRYGPNVWARNITSDYPNQGFKIPYERYKGSPEILQKILFIPDNNRNFKYATRHFSDDSALGLIEKLSEIVGVLQEIGDKSENWAIRQEWLASVMAELWKERGLYPGLLSVLDFLKFPKGIHYAIGQIPVIGEEEIKKKLFSFIEGNPNAISDIELTTNEQKSLNKRWKYLEDDEQQLLKDVLIRFDLPTFQIDNIINGREKVSITSNIEEILESPYILSEEYIGEDPDDQISFSQIDHGLLPSPDLGVGVDIEPDDWQRLRALCVEQLKRSSQHTFLSAERILFGLNKKLSFMPEWKRAQFSLKHLKAEKEDLSRSLCYRTENDTLFLYLRSIYMDERVVEEGLRLFAGLPNISLQFPVTQKHWENFLKIPQSSLAQEHPEEYQKAISKQVEICQKIFQRPLSILSGAAGTGKTTIIKAIIKAIEKAHGAQPSFQLLAPTGKAADRLREQTGKDANTIHAFLAQRGWLSPNLTFKQIGGQREENITTYIIDESSMLDLRMLATFFRAINLNSVQRIIFVGDPNQLPPIGTGKVFSDLIDWLKTELEENVGELTTNIRQIHNRLSAKGTGILDLASLYQHRVLAEEKSGDIEAQEEEILEKIQEGGDIAGDLRVLFWDSTDALEKVLLDTIVSDMEADTGQTFDKNRPDNLWDEYFNSFQEIVRPERNQVISPYRGELFGIENLNKLIQSHKNDWMLQNKGSVGGITYRDKVIQTCNRSRSKPLWAYNTATKKSTKLEVFNGEIGLSKIHGYDHKKWKWSKFRMSQFQVIFSRKQQFWAEFNSDRQVEENLELAYSISVHKAQGSEFERVYFVLPKHKRGLLSQELFYTGLTRAQNHCTILVEEDMSPIYSLRRPENSQLARINSSLFNFTPVPEEFQDMFEWYEEGKIHRTLAEYMVRSKSEVIIANMLFERDIPFDYEVPLRASDGTTMLPDFTINLRGDVWYWEHEGMLHNEEYRNRQEVKHEWYNQHGFADKLIVTKEGTGFDSKAVSDVIKQKFGL